MDNGYHDEQNHSVFSDQERAEEPQRKAGFKHVFQVLYHPSETFEQIHDAGHAWLFPFIVMLLVMIFSIVAGLPELRSSLVQSMQELGAADITVEATMTIIITFTFILLPIVFFVGVYIIPSAVFMFFGNFIIGGKARYREIINVTAFAFVPLLISTALTQIINSFGDSYYFVFSPQILLPSGLRETFIGNWLGIFQLFNIWILILLIIGLAVLYRLSRARIAAWLIPLYLAVFTFMAMLTSLMNSYLPEM